jgi:hypothetical protein
MAFDDFFQQDEFMIDPEDLETPQGESWDTGIQQDIFASGEKQDIFNTRDAM